MGRLTRCDRRITAGLVAAGAWWLGACDDGVRPLDRGGGGGSVGLTAARAEGRPVLLRNGAADGRCLDVAGASREVGAALTLWDCTGAPQEQFVWSPGGALRVYDGTDAVLCVTNASADARAGAPAVVARCADGEAGQRWEPDGGGRVRLAGTPYCLAAGPRAGADEGDAPVTLARCAGGDPTQEWAGQAAGAGGPAVARAGGGPARSSSGVGCGASATVTTYEVDSLMSAYGIPALEETTTLCQTWVGGDYSLRFATDASSDDATPLAAPEVRTATYDAGTASGLDGNGASVAAPQSTGGTVLDYMYADDATRQAAADDPYYGLRATGSGCANPTQIVCDPGNARAPADGLRLSAAVAPDSAVRKFLRHGLVRRGVRALVDDKEEITAGPDGSRRFRKRTGDEEVVVSLARGSELLVGEEVTAPSRRLKATHQWARRGTGWVRDRTDVEEVETVNGRRVRSTATIRFANVRVE